LFEEKKDVGLAQELIHVLRGDLLGDFTSLDFRKLRIYGYFLWDLRWLIYFLLKSSTYSD
jgi:hypothetical protein